VHLSGIECQAVSARGTCAFDTLNSNALEFSDIRKPPSSRDEEAQLDVSRIDLESSVDLEAQIKDRYCSEEEVLLK